MQLLTGFSDLSFIGATLFSKLALATFSISSEKKPRSFFQSTLLFTVTLDFIPLPCTALPQRNTPDLHYSISFASAVLLALTKRNLAESRKAMQLPLSDNSAIQKRSPSQANFFPLSMHSLENPAFRNGCASFSESTETPSRERDVRQSSASCETRPEVVKAERAGLNLANCMLRSTPSISPTRSRT